MKNLIISGKANSNLKIDQIRQENSEVWLCGTDERNGADLYFELHHLKTKHSNVVCCLPAEVYEFNLPINNTICAMLVYAYLKGYRKIDIVGCPMIAKDEYIRQRPALAYVVGWLNGKGLEVNWSHCPHNINYGKL